MKNNKTRLCPMVFAAFLTIFMSLGCTKQLYQKALADAAQLDADKQSKSLTKLSNENPNLIWRSINGERYLKVSSWKADAKYYKNDPKTGMYNTGKYPIWVTAEPDMQQWLMAQKRQYKKPKALEKRLHQLLGLPPNADKKVFVVFWVRPQDLIRPCLDMEVTDSSCELFLASGASPDCENLAWLMDQTRASFADSTLYNRYPFTQLGYTYDWNRKNKRHVGLSEFVIGKNKSIVVDTVYQTADYFPKKQGS